MHRNYLVQYLIHILKFLLRYALYGAGITLTAAVVILLISYLVDGSAIDSARVIATIQNYLILGATFGGIIGLLYGLLTYRS